MPGMGLIQHMLEEPLWLQAWLFWMFILNSLAVAFWRRREGRWVLLAWLLNLTFMPLLYEAFGYVRLLGLSHILFWTPLVIALARAVPGVPAGDAYGKWIRTVLVTNAISLVIDYVDLVRYLAGDTAA